MEPGAEEVVRQVEKRRRREDERGQVPRAGVLRFVVGVLFHRRRIHPGRSLIDFPAEEES
jgi:hypothetical protein